MTNNESKNIRAVELGKYIVETSCTVRDAAKQFDLGKSTVHKDVTERFPNVEKLIVPVERLAESRAKIRDGGNALSKYYNDLLVQIRQKGAVE